MKPGISAENEISLLFALPVLNRMVWTTADFRRFGFTKTQVMIFSVLSYRGFLSVGEIASYIAASKEQTSRAVAQMVEEGYVHREMDPHKHTRVRISLTDCGRALMEQCRSEFTENLNTCLNQSLTEEEIKAFCASTETILCLLNKLGKSDVSWGD